MVTECEDGIELLHEGEVEMFPHTSSDPRIVFLQPRTQQKSNSLSSPNHCEMRRLSLRVPQQRRAFHVLSRRNQKGLPIVHIEDGTFYRQYPSEDSGSHTKRQDAAIFPHLDISLPANDHVSEERQYWSILSSSSLARTTFLQVLHGDYICVPPQSRTFPYLLSPAVTNAKSRITSNAIKYVGFDAERGGIGGTALKGAYLSARYESRKEESDWSLLDYLTGNTELNPSETKEGVDGELLDKVIKDLRLTKLLDTPVSNLSNGQTRRARIAKSLMGKPELLLLDGPFMGLDPPTVVSLSSVLKSMAERNSPRLVLSLRPEDHVPDWISHLALIDDGLKFYGSGKKEDMLSAFSEHMRVQNVGEDKNRQAIRSSRGRLSSDGFEQDSPAKTDGRAIVEMSGVKVSYGERAVLGDWEQESAGHSGSQPGLHWNIRRGQRWGIFGPNGSGKTTLLSLITSDHPQTYSLPVKLFGRSRLPSPGELGISIFELQRRMGHSSPEVHTFFPRHLTVRKALESAWADTPMSKPNLSEEARSRVSACLRWFYDELNTSTSSRPVSKRTSISELEQRYQAAMSKFDKAAIAHLVQEAQDLLQDSSALSWADELRFRDLPFSSQRLLLFVRSMIAEQDLVILDEAFSGMDPSTRTKALLFLSHGEMLSCSSDTGVQPSLLADMEEVAVHGLSDQQALVTISHSKEDVPGCVRDWICLPDPGEGRSPRWGTLKGPLELNPQGWDKIWGVEGHGDENA